MQKKLKLCSDGGDMVGRNVKEAMLAPMVVSDGFFVRREFGVWSQAISFELVHLVGIWIQSPLRYIQMQFALRGNVMNFTHFVRFAKMILKYNELVFNRQVFITVNFVC
jgi:hypothetical protein